MKDAGNITRDEAGNSFFTVNDRTYKLGRMNWQYEEKFLIAMNKAGVDLTGDRIGEKKSYDVDLFTEKGTELRKELIPWLFFKKSDDEFIQMEPFFQESHFRSVIEVYEVLAKEIEAISYFLSQAQASNRANSSQKPASSSAKTSSLKTPNQTLRK